MPNFTLTINDGAKIPMQLLKDGAAFNIPTDASVKAAIVSSDNTRVLSDVVTLTPSEAGSDWSVSTVVAVFTSAQITGIISNANIQMEIQVTESGGDPLTWYWEDGKAKQGHIS